MGKIKQLIAALTVIVIGVAYAGDAPFGTKDDVKYSERLWKTLEKADLVGEDKIMANPYKGTPPHGAVLDTIHAKVKMRGNGSQPVIIKRNYGGEDITVSKVADDPGKYLKAVTVMYKRPGYDPENKDWFWAKYKPDGTLHSNPKGMSLAGRVAKGMPKGCIACHKAADGGDYVFGTNRIE